MTIKIRSGKLRLAFWMPLSLLKSRLGYKICTSIMANNVNARSMAENGHKLPHADTTQATVSNEAGDGNKPKIVITRQQLKELYTVLRQCVKRDGHFNLVEVNSPSSNAHVRIRV